MLPTQQASIANAEKADQDCNEGPGLFQRAGAVVCWKLPRPETDRLAATVRARIGMSRSVDHRERRQLCVWGVI